MSEESQTQANTPTPIGPDEVAEFVKNARSRPLKATMWLEGKSLVYPTRLAPVSKMMDRSLYLERMKDSSNDELVTNLAKMGAEVFVLVWFSGRGRYAFRTRMTALTENGLQLEPPTEVLFLQRRKARRFVIPAGYEVEVSASVMVPREDGAPPVRETRRFRVFDVGEAGISLLLSEDETGIFPKGTVLEGATLLIRQKSIFFSGTVMNREKLGEPRGEKNHKAGIHFSEISEQDLMFLKVYITEHSIQYHGHTGRKANIKG